MRFQATGKLPSGIRPSSPLITLLEQIGAQDLAGIRGLTVDMRLGYAGSRTFQTAGQALLWLKPAAEVFGSFPAESWRIKECTRQLFLEDLQECSENFPERLLQERKSLMRRPQRHSPRP